MKLPRRRNRPADPSQVGERTQQRQAPDDSTMRRADLGRAVASSGWPTGPEQQTSSRHAAVGKARSVSDRTSRGAGWGKAPIMLAPTRVQLVDLSLLAALCIVALEGFRLTYGGWQYLFVGILGVVLGIVIGHLGAALRQPLLAALAAAVLTFFLLGGAVALRENLAVGFLPTGKALRSLSSVSVHGWKDLLTTLPPVGNTGALLVIPYLLGILGGVAGASLAERTKAAFAPLLAPVALLVGVILLGTNTPASLLLQGGVFAALAIGWLALRSRRARVTLRTGTGNRVRFSTAIAMVAVAGVLGMVVGPHLPGHGGHRRLVLRDYITPPFDVSQFPSPLAAFRKYTKTGRLNTTPLFQVKGLPSGIPVKIATLDDYNGTAWVASNTISQAKGTSTFQRIGSTINAIDSGKKVSAQITIDSGYSDVWVPAVGELTKIRFSGGDAALRAFRYNLASSTGVMQAGLHQGERIRLDAVVPSQTSKDYSPFGEPIVSPDYFGITQSKIAAWSGNANTPWDQLKNIGQWLVSNGKYSDGGNGNDAQSRFFAGHGLGRLTTMLSAPEIVGDDEQYAALYALAAGQLGFPARVVLGAVPESDGTVQGKDVHAWVEVHLASGEWFTIPTKNFVPDKSKTPNTPPQEQEQNSEGKDVPPPNTVKPPTTQQNPEEPQSNASRNPNKKKHNALHVPLPSVVLKILAYVGLPLLVIAAISGTIIGLKHLRRRRRRRRGTTSDQIAAGWQEVLDRARDFGATISPRQTRLEQARALGHPALPGLATRANSGVFSAGVPSRGAVEAYWIEVTHARRDLGAGRSRWRRIRASLSLRSLRAHRVRRRRNSAAGPRRVRTA